MTAPVKRGRRGPRRALTEDEILDAALGLLDEGGPAAASVRGIAAKVGVAPNAVYTYFPDINLPEANLALSPPRLSRAGRCARCWLAAGWCPTARRTLRRCGTGRRGRS
jgi:hypothetical protein